MENIMKNVALILALILLTSCYTVVRVTETSSRRIVTASYTPPTFYYSPFLYPWDRYYPYSYDRFYYSYPNYYSYYYNPYRPLIVVEKKKKEDRPKATSYTPPRNTPVRTSGVNRSIPRPPLRTITRPQPTPPTRPTQVRKVESTNTRGEVKRVETTTSRGEVKKTETQPQRRTSGESRTSSENKGTVRRGN